MVVVWGNSTVTMAGMLESFVKVKLGWVLPNLELKIKWLCMSYELWLHADLVVTVVTDPPSGPYPIGSTVNLTCLIHPQPPGEGVTYQWRDYVPNTSPVVANSSLPYATLTIGRGHPHIARYYCWVYYRNQVLVTGNTVITVQGKLHLSYIPIYFS